MPFIIPNHTKCSICALPINDNIESLILPYVDTDKHSAFQKFPRTYVHRACFRSWEAKSKYLELSIDLKKNEPQDPDCIFSKEYINIIRQGFLTQFVVQDSREIFEIEIPFDLSKNIPLLLDFIKDTEQKNFTLGEVYFTRNNGDLQVNVFQNEKLSMKVDLPKNRIAAWKKALTYLTEKLETPKT